MFYRARREGRTVLVREPYNVVEWDGETFIEGTPNQALDLVTGRGTKLNAEEMYEDVRIFDYPPYPNSRIGSGF